MGLFRRRRDSGPDPRAQAAAVTAFWSWWTAGGSAQVAAAIEDRSVQGQVDPLNRRVASVDGRLAWELGAGTDGSRHRLVVSPEGDPAVRGIARRWLLAAPPADGTWCYADSRQPLADPEDAALGIGDEQVTVRDTVVAARVVGAEVEVSVHHPAFARLPEKEQRQAAMLMLDWVLGENEVEAWVGEIRTTPVAPLDPVPVTGLRSVVEELRRRHTDADGSPGWAVLEGTTPDGAAVVALAQQPLKAVTAPQLDTYLRVVVPYTDRTDAGLPGPAALAELRALEDHLRERLGGSGRIVALQSSDGVRVLHTYVDGTTPAAGQLEAAVTGWRQGRVTVDASPDPGWQHVAHLRG
jgi:hypothetical protein